MNNKNIVRKLLLAASIASFVFMVILIVWSLIAEINFLEEKYHQYISWLSALEYKVAAIENKWLIVLVVWLLYFILSAFPVIPISILCVATSMVFNVVYSFIINAIGLLLLFAVRYSTGVKLKMTGILKLMSKNRFLRKIIESEGKSDAMVLFTMRLLPMMPIGPVSQLYGAIGFPFYKYLIISIVGFIPKIISYIVIGQSFLNPFAPEFYIPLIVLTALCGVAFLCIHGALDMINRIKKNS